MEWDQVISDGKTGKSAMAIMLTHLQDGTMKRSVSAVAAGAAVGFATEHLFTSCGHLAKC